MSKNEDPQTPELDPALVEAMKARTVKRKARNYGKTKPGPGRPKGISKPKGSGRKAGTPNIWTPEFRQWLADRAKPFELLADVCAGHQIMDGGKNRKPTLTERLRAAETLGRKLLPDLQATAITAPELAALGDQKTDGHSVFDVARSVAFVLASGVDAQDALQSEKIEHGEVVPDPEPHSDGAVSQSDMPARSQVYAVGTCTIELTEVLNDGRESWAIRDENGFLAGSCFGRASAELKAKQITERADDKPTD